MSLVRGVFALTHTKRGRVLWCAWWTGEPCADPFRAPDAWGAGARTEEDAQKKAEEAAGIALARIEGRWAGAWVRVRNGRAPFPRQVPRSVDADATRAPRAPSANGNAPSVHEILGVPENATLAQVKAAFRAKVTTAHPDQGGDPRAFMELMRAYQRLVARRENPRRRAR